MGYTSLFVCFHLLDMETVTDIQDSPLRNAQALRKSPLLSSMDRLPLRDVQYFACDDARVFQEGNIYGHHFNDDNYTSHRSRPSYQDVRTQNREPQSYFNI